MFNFTRAIVRHTQNNIGKYARTRINGYSSAPVSVELKSPVSEPRPPVIKTKTVKSTNSIVAAAFASLSNEKSPPGESRTPFGDGRIEKASSVDELLSISAEGVGVSRRHALKVVSILATWSTTGRVKLSEFESDARFVRLCRVLTKTAVNGKSRVVGKSEDLSMIMNVTGDDEAAKLVASITLPQMVKVMQTLAFKKRRSTTLLRSLSYNITKNPGKLELKEAADLLYSMCVLNFPDANLLEKACADILRGYNAAKKSSVIGSIITSLGLLKYKDTSGMFDALCAWMYDNRATCRTQDLFALFLTVGALDHRPANADALFDALAPLLSASDAPRATVWLDHVWSLVVHERADRALVDGVLDAAFVARCGDGVAARVKLLHVNAASDGAHLPADSAAFATRVARTKEKADMVDSVLDALKNLMQGDAYVKSDVDTRMGFCIDAECVIDAKCMPVAHDRYAPSEGHVKLAIMALDYHDMCRGRVSPTGVVVLQRRLLERRGYKVVHVPFHEYRLHDKLVHRVQLVESKLKAVVAPPST